MMLPPDIALDGEVEQVKAETTFRFACHRQVPCFTECCRLLELALTPYDVLRLRRGTGLTSQQLLDQYIIVEQEEGDPFPRFYLTMVDDGRASCVFVSNEGCVLYGHRPGACRAYPLGRAATRNCAGSQEHFVLIHEKHCRGFDEPKEQTAISYGAEQGLDDYNRYNDAVATLLQHGRFRQGLTLTPAQAELFTLALYNIDTFRAQLEQGQIAAPKRPDIINQSDEELLLFAVDWLKEQFFSAGQ